MATSTQQKQELFKAIWAIAEDLRNSVDGWDFKSYVLGILFYRFISENITNYVNRMQNEAGDSDFDYAKFSDEEAESARTDLVKEKGFLSFRRNSFAMSRQEPRMTRTSMSLLLRFSSLSRLQLSAQIAKTISKVYLPTLM